MEFVDSELSINDNMLLPNMLVEAINTQTIVYEAVQKETHAQEEKKQR